MSNAHSDRRFPQLPLARENFCVGCKKIKACTYCGNHCCLYYCFECYETHILITGKIKQLKEARNRLNEIISKLIQQKSTEVSRINEVKNAVNSVREALTYNIANCRIRIENKSKELLGDIEDEKKESERLCDAIENMDMVWNRLADWDVRELFYFIIIYLFSYIS